MILVAGLGITGQSVLTFLQSKKTPCIAFDTRADFDTATLKNNYPNVQFYTGVLPQKNIVGIEKIILSPGIPLASAWLKPFKEKNIPIVGDIELFAELADKPIISITGSNGKSTVTSLVTEILTEEGYQVGMGGNIGVPVLDLLMDEKNYNLYVLELSSFQLETTYSLHSVAATILNISEDHMDRYASFNDYVCSKKRIFKNAKAIILPEFDYQRYQISNPRLFGGDKLQLAGQQIMPVKEMALQGKHHLLNAQAAVALTESFNISVDNYSKVFKRYRGLAHRTQTVIVKNGIEWVNDSKGTNIGATLTAIESLSTRTNGLILIAGGVGKGADFSLLKKSVAKHCKAVILFGRDAKLISRSISPLINKGNVTCVNELSAAVNVALSKASSGDIVLFSPACASFDQFKNYEKRGEIFETLVKAVTSD